MVRRGGRGQKQQAGSAPAAGPAEAAEDSPAAFDPDELLPRADISGHITGKLVTSLGSVNWKERNAAVEEVEEILKAAGGRIQPSLGDLMPALKVRWEDSTLYLSPVWRPWEARCQPSISC